MEKASDTSGENSFRKVFLSQQQLVSVRSIWEISILLFDPTLS